MTQHALLQNVEDYLQLVHQYYAMKFLFTTYVYLKQYISLFYVFKGNIW